MPHPSVLVTFVCVCAYVFVLAANRALSGRMLCLSSASSCTPGWQPIVSIRSFFRLCVCLRVFVGGIEKKQINNTKKAHKRVPTSRPTNKRFRSNANARREGAGCPNTRKRNGQRERQRKERVQIRSLGQQQVLDSVDRHQQTVEIGLKVCGICVNRIYVYFGLYCVFEQ